MAFSLLPKSYADIKTYITNQIISNYPALGAFLYHSFIFIFIDVISWAIALFMDYADNLYSEFLLPTATNYENARKIALFYGYVAHRKISAKGSIKIGMTSSFTTLPTESFVIGKYDALKIGGIDFLMNETMVFSSNPNDPEYQGLPTGQYYLEMPVIQGKRITVNNVAQGIVSETFTISDENIENTEIVVTVNGTEWTSVDSFFVSGPTDQHYTIENLENMRGVEITFGNGVFGAKLSNGDTISISYTQTSGLDGQLKASNLDVVFGVVYKYSDLTPIDPYGITISQMIEADGIDTLESIKYWGQQSVSTIGDVAFQDDQVQLALNEYGGILRSKAVSEYDINPDNPTPEYMNTVKLLIVPTSGTALDAVAKQNIRSYLRKRMDFTDLIDFIDIQYIDILFQLDIDAYVTAPKNLGAQVDSYLQSTYALENMQFRQSMDHSQITSGLNSNFSSYIKRFYLTLWVTEKFTPPTIQTGSNIITTLELGGLTSPGPNINLVKMIAEFTNPTAATETFLDTFPGGSSFYTSGTSNHNTGVVSIFLQPSVAAVQSLEYQYIPYDLNGETINIDIAYNQIARYGSSLININFTEQ